MRVVLRICALVVGYRCVGRSGSSIVVFEADLRRLITSHESSARTGCPRVCSFGVVHYGLRGQR